MMKVKGATEVHRETRSLLKCDGHVLLLRALICE